MSKIFFFIIAEGTAVFEIWWFYFKIQLTTVLKTTAFALVAGFALIAIDSFIGPEMALTSFAFSWSLLLLLPSINYQWMATLPLSRLALLLARTFILATGACLNFFALVSTSLILVFLRGPTSHFFVKTALPTPPVPPTGNSVRMAPPGSESEIHLTVFGDSRLYGVAFVIGFLVLYFFLIASSAHVMGAVGRQTQKSGNPFWHLNRKIRWLYWGLLAAIPLILFFTAKWGDHPLIGAFNFLLLFLGAAYLLSLQIAMHVKMPKGGSRLWTIWVVGIYLSIGLTLITGQMAWKAALQLLSK
jgi:hypothetical protein